VRWGLAGAALIASGCTCLFAPNRVKIPCDPPVAPPLDVVAGDGTSLTFEWPVDPSRDDITEWELCWGATACKKVQPRACDGGLCSVTIDGADGGFQYNQRVQARVTMKNACGDVSAPATASSTPLNGSFRDTQGIELISGCDAGIKILVPGELTLDQQGFLCISTAMMGDEQWRDATLDLEVRVPADGFAGFGVRAARDGGSAAARNGIVVSPAPGAQASAFITRRAVLGADNGADVVAASAVPLVRGNDWEAMRVSMAGEWFSVSLGDDATKLREVMRWRDRTSPTPSGRLGVALATTLGGSRIDVRNLRVRTSVTIPDGGPSSDSWSFTGADPAHGIRMVGNNAGVVMCPGYLAAPGASAPDGGGCLQVMGGSSATVEVPIGLDFNRPWRVSFKFGAGPVANNPSLLRTTVVGPNPNALNGFAGFGIIDVPGLNWNQELRAFEQPTDTLGMLTPMTWNTFEVIFNPGTNGYTIRRNGMLARAGTQPASWAQHLGALVLGGGTLNAHYADLEISQDP